LRPGGSMSLVVPAKLWRSLAGGGVRELLASRTCVREVHDLSQAPQLFDAAVYPSVIVASKVEHSVTPVIASGYRSRTVERWTVSRTRLAFDDSIGSPWLIIPPSVRKSFDRVRKLGRPLSETTFGRPLLGTKTGCNEAFMASASSPIESHLLRPVIRGDRVRPWAVPSDEGRIIWTHDRDGALRTLPPEATRHFARWRRDLERRSDIRGKERWWSLFRTESADSSISRVVWTDIGKTPRAAVLPAGDRSVPLNTCYVIRCREVDDAFALAALINSRLAAAWLSIVAEPARGGYKRFLGWTMSLLPLPADWTRAREILSPIARHAVSGAIVNEDDLLRSTLSAYGLDHPDVECLLDWSE